MSRRVNWTMDILDKLLTGKVTVEEVEKRIRQLRDSLDGRSNVITEMTRQQTMDKATLKIYHQALLKYQDKIKPRGQYIRDGIYTIEDVFNIMGQGTIVTPEGHKINTNSKRYILFRQKGTKCVACGIEGQYFAKEKDKHHVDEVYHFNLYAVKDGKEILMTQDHIKPKSLKGSNDLSNLQPMCMPCNCAKGSKYEEEAQEQS